MSLLAAPLLLGRRDLGHQSLLCRPSRQHRPPRQLARKGGTPLSVCVWVWGCFESIGGEGGWGASSGARVGCALGVGGVRSGCTLGVHA